MNNAEKFKEIFGLYATELWAKPESDLLKWLNQDYDFLEPYAQLINGHQLYKSLICETCSNNPKNGGSGICHCTLGTPQITC